MRLGSRVKALRTLCVSNLLECSLFTMFKNENKRSRRRRRSRKGNGVTRATGIGPAPGGLKQSAAADSERLVR